VTETLPLRFLSCWHNHNQQKYSLHQYQSRRFHYEHLTRNVSYSDLLFVTNIGFSIFMSHSLWLQDTFIMYVHNHRVCYRHYQCWQPSWLQPPLLAMILSCHSVQEVNWIRLTFHVVINVACLSNIQASFCTQSGEQAIQHKTS